MKVLFIMPKIEHVARVDFPPIGLACLAAYLRQKIGSIKIKIIDFGVENFSEKRFVNTLNIFKPDFLGVSVSTLHYPHAVKLANTVRKHSPETKIIWGGPHVDTEFKECLGHCDYVVIGEGEITFCELINKLSHGEKVKKLKGIAYKKDGKIIRTPPRERIENLDELPWPAYDLLNIEKYFEYPLVGIMGSRGCPFNCTFCDSPLRWKRIVKKMSVKNIVDEIEFLNQNFGVKGIYFFDDILNLPQERAISICDEIIKRGLNKKLYFQAMLRGNKSLISEELFRKLKKANFNRISFGVESGSQKVLDAMNKHITIQELERAIKLSIKSGIDTRAFFMIGNWDEDFTDILKTVRFILKMGISPGLSIATPLPGTEFYNKLKSNGYLKEVDWSKATTKIALNKTNKMSKTSINIIYRITYYFFYFKKIFDLPIERKIDFLKKKIMFIRKSHKL